MFRDGRNRPAQAVNRCPERPDGGVHDRDARLSCCSLEALRSGVSRRRRRRKRPRRDVDIATVVQSHRRLGRQVVFHHPARGLAHERHPHVRLQGVARRHPEAARARRAGRATVLSYRLQCLDDLAAMLNKHGDWMPLGNADEGKPVQSGTVEVERRHPWRIVVAWPSHWPRPWPDVDCNHGRGGLDALACGTCRHAPHIRRLGVVPRRRETPRDHRRGALRDPVAESAPSVARRAAVFRDRNLSQGAPTGGRGVPLAARRRPFALRRG